MTIFAQLRDTADQPLTARALEHALIQLITDGGLAAGAKLPPVRDAAYALGCAPGTVSRAYAALQARGLTHAQVGRGTFVGESATTSEVVSGVTADDTHVDLSRNIFVIESVDALLGEAFAAVANGVAAAQIPSSCVGGMGWAPDREAVLPIIARWRDDPVVEGVTLTNGAQGGISAAIAAFVPPSAALACDTLTYPGVMVAARALGRKVVPVANDEHGMMPDALDAACKRYPIAAVIVMPTIHNPTGGSMPESRRGELAAVADRRDLTVLEDEVYGFLGDEMAAFFSRLIPNRTVLIYSLAKSVAAGLRVGYAAGPEPLVRRLSAAHNALSLMVSPVLSSAASHIIRTGAYERRVDCLRSKLIDRAAYVACQAPELDRLAAERGLIWLTLPDGWCPDEFRAEAKELGVLVAPGREFAVESHASPNAVRISVGAVESEDRFRFAFDTLMKLRETPYAAEMTG